MRRMGQAIVPFDARMLTVRTVRTQVVAEGLL